MSKAQLKKILTNPITVLLGGFASLLVAQLIASLFVYVSGVESQLITAGMITGISLAVLVAIAWALLKLTDGSWGALGVAKPKTGWVKRTAGYLGLYYLFSYTLQLVTALLVPQFDVSQTQDVGISSYSVPIFVQSLVILVLLTPLLEEFLFRGLLFKGLRRRSSFVLAALSSSALFAVAHGQWNVALDTFVLGLFLAKLVEDTGSLVPAVALHASKNAIALGLLFALNNL